MKTTNLFTRATKPILMLVAAFLAAFTAKVDAQTIDIGPNQYAFQFTQNPNFGLFFNSTNSQYEFRNGSAIPVFSFNANNGDLTTNLQFASGSDYLVGNNTYAFRSAANPNYGLFFNSSNLRYEFRGSTGNSLFQVDASNGNVETSGTINAFGGSSTEWNQAHDWGDHAAEGYINAESDPKISEDLENLDVPFWNGSELRSSAITAGTSTARVTGSPGNFAIPGAPEGSTGNLFILENPGVAPGTIGLTGESRLAFSKDGVVTGRISTAGNDMNFAATDGGNISLRTGGNDRMTILPNGDVGLGLTDPSHRLHVSGTVRATTGSYAIRGTKTGDGTFPGVWGETESTSANASGVRGFVTSTAPGGNSAGVYGHNFSTTSFGIGVRGIQDGTGWGVYGESNGGRGVYGNSEAGSSTGTAYGVYGRAAGSGGTRIGVYGIASGGTSSWAGYFAGATYVSGDLRVGTLSGATGYKLSVNGKAICTEMRVQLTSNWPDYVFDDSYDRLSLDELEDFIQTEKHLPNIPSANEIETQGGVDLGEMQRLTIEKVEELTLYLLELKESNDALSAKSEDLSAENEALRARIEALEN
ncbi:hypothetical protein O3Q51_05075 [Cryomorphaceae bacterium 1068]|nr:hypothetical protein [Cryomorphaceae bacterium 1068]